MRTSIRFAATGIRHAAMGILGMLLAAVAVQAQDPVLEELYGEGVHEFFANNFQQAIADLDQAANGGSKDPRVYYFRAMARLRNGDNSGADADMQRGADLESADVNRFYPVSRSLERVQGSSRLMLERYRTKARAEAYMRAERRNEARYEEQRRAEADVLRNAPSPAAMAPAAAPPAAGRVAPAPGKVAPPPAEDDTDPFAEEPAEAPAAKAAPAEDEDPFASGAPGMPDEENPAGGDAELADMKGPADMSTADDTTNEEDLKGAGDTDEINDLKADNMEDEERMDEDSTPPAKKPATKAGAKGKAGAAKAAAEDEDDSVSGNPFMDDDAPGMDEDDPKPKAGKKGAKPAAGMDDDSMMEDEK